MYIKQKSHWLPKQNLEYATYHSRLVIFVVLFDLRPRAIALKHQQFPRNVQQQGLRFPGRVLNLWPWRFRGQGREENPRHTERVRDERAHGNFLHLVDVDGRVCKSKKKPLKNSCSKILIFTFVVVSLFLFVPLTHRQPVSALVRFCVTTHNERLYQNYLPLHHASGLIQEI
jgi:hypothetical protein